VGAALWWRLRRQLSINGVRRGPTWDCGYLAPTARMQYTGRSLTAWLGDLIPGLRASVVMPRLLELFPRRSTLGVETPDALGERLYQPWLIRRADQLMKLRWLQQGLLHVYLLYVLIALVVAFAWMLVAP